MNAQKMIADHDRIDALARGVVDAVLAMVEQGGREARPVTRFDVSLAMGPTRDAAAVARRANAILGRPVNVNGETTYENVIEFEDR